MSDPASDKTSTQLPVLSFPRSSHSAARTQNVEPGIGAEQGAALEEQDRLEEYCGLFGIFGHPEASKLTYLGLHSLQHRGQESAGVVSSDGQQLHSHRGLGLVSEVFKSQALEPLLGHSAIGHVLYSTKGKAAIEDAQPLTIREHGGFLSVAHNGGLINAEKLRQELEGQGAVFSSRSDPEVLLHLVARQQEGSLEARLAKALSEVSGAWSLLFLSTDKLIATRDPYGFRPLVLGKLNDAWVVASETCAFNLVGAEYVREVKPGELIIIDNKGLHSQQLFPPPKRGGLCSFELVYFSRPDSIVFGRSVYATRKRLGHALARENPVEVDLVIPVPDSGVAGALGYAEEAKVPFELGLIRSHYIGRTFIEPSQSIRHFGVKLKLSVVADVVAGKRVAVVDDSLVRGTTARKIVKMLKAAGAREVHLRMTSPPIRFPCFYGIDTPNRKELIAATHSVDEIARYVTADSLAYLSVEHLHQVLGTNGKQFCDACFTGDYPVPVSEAPDAQLELEMKKGN